MADRKRNRNAVFAFSEAGGMDAAILGGKAASLVTMTNLGLPVPPGFVVETGVCRAFAEHQRAPQRVDGQIRREMKKLESLTGRVFGSSHAPLLVSVRSGAEVSMPGMMDTVLNLGLTSRVLKTLEREAGNQFVRDVYARFTTGFEKVVRRIAPDDAWQQLHLAMVAVWQSWFSSRAMTYRQANGIPNSLGTAVTIQAMTFGLGANSGTGVAFSRNVATGDPILFGEYLPNAQGEDVVSGTVTPLPISALAELNPQVYRELCGWVGVLEDHYQDVVDVEFTVENGRLWILQCRPAKRTPTAAARFAVQAVWEKRTTKAEAVASLNESSVEALARPVFDEKSVQKAVSSGQLFAQGLPAAPGAVIGSAVFTAEQAKKVAKQGGRPILFRPDTNPDDLEGMMAAVAIVTANGGVTSHAAVVARALGCPAVVGAGKLEVFTDRAVSDCSTIRLGDPVSVDGTSGSVFEGSIPLATGNSGKEISILLKWINALRPELLETKIEPDFRLLDQKQIAMQQYCSDFYLSDAMVTACAGTGLEGEARSVRKAVLKEVGTFLTTYLITAVAGEIRYMPTREIDEDDESGCTCKDCKQLAALKKAQASDYPEYRGLKEFGIKFGSSREKRRLCQRSVANKLQDSSPDERIRFLQLAESAFTRMGSNTNTGGVKWAAIARAPLKLLSNQMKLAVFIDHAFDLQHNGGMLFDKHPMVSYYTDEGRLRRMLDGKKRAQNIAELKYLLFKWGSTGSPAVMALWEKGVKLGLWQDS